jgi:ABC-2 type transport system permease protein
MRALWKMTIIETKLFLREPAAVFFTLAFPIMVLLLFGGIFGGYPIPGTDLRSIDLYAPALTGMIIGTVGLIGLPTTVTSYRETGALRRLRATPLRPSTILGSQVLVNLFMTMFGIALLLITARLVFDIRVPDDPLSVAVALIFSSLSFFTAGFVLAGVLPTVRVASAVGQAIFLPMLFLSGAVMPRDELPDAVRRISDLLPLTYVVNLIQDLWIGEGWNWPAATVLLGMLVVGVILSARTFRWE